MAADISKLREMSVEELDKEERNLRMEVWKLRVQQGTGQLSNFRKVRQTRKELARVMTIRKERELARS
ncbi:MAG: 50S ribosomal protein L29 [Acidobacteria bacterium]|uniref:Large ribosomal subunit protein uL29 n=1 Tax=Candidatus Polarisedimenticola svalbardensis TaxID=2886004 RepID=A0A8J6Y210_9BACT|nr:50S ribosomal protein L29 [Candidatus Polarisedimenticola svalbardensis]